MAVPNVDSNPDISQLLEVIEGASPGALSFEHPIVVCPTCYEQRDATIPVVRVFFGSRAVFVLPSGERLKPAEGHLSYCPRCDWRQEG